MNITEATQVNRLLEYVLRQPEASEVGARAAAEFLADRASRALGAGLDDITVRVLWRDGSALIADEVRVAERLSTIRDMQQGGAAERLLAIRDMQQGAA